MRDYIALFYIMFFMNWVEGLILLGTILFGTFVKMSNKKLLVWLGIFMLLRIPLLRISCTIGYGCRDGDSTSFFPEAAVSMLYFGFNVLVLFAILRIKKLISRG